MKIYVILLVLLLPMVASAQYQPHAIWSREGAGDSSLYGSEILALGDQNDDGFNDWAVYAAGLGYAPAGHPNEPRVEFFHGGNPPDNVPYMVRVADRATEISVRGAKALGDLNGDGYIDWYIFTGYIGDTTGRHIYKIYFGGPGPHEEPNLILTSPWLSGYRSIGDFNGDDFDDLLLSDGYNDRALVYYGGNPMDTIPDWNRDEYLVVEDHGDLNGDGYSDFVSIAYIDVVNIFLGSIAPDTIPAYHWLMNNAQIAAIIPKLNGDNYDDLGYAYPHRLNIHFGALVLDTIVNTTLSFPCELPHFVTSAGDFNRDGFGDCVMLTEWCQDSWYGTLAVHLGSWWINPEPAYVILGWTEPFNLIHIRTATSLGDINGDHVDDLAIGANGGIEYIAQRGKAVVLAGDTSLHVAADDPLIPLPDDFTIAVYPNPFNSNATFEIIHPAYVHDITLTIYNLIGQEVFRTDIAPQAGTIQYHFDASALSTGLYLLHVSVANMQKTTKLILLR